MKKNLLIGFDEKIQLKKNMAYFCHFRVAFGVKIVKTEKTEKFEFFAQK